MPGERGRADASAIKAAQAEGAAQRYARHARQRRVDMARRASIQRAGAAPVRQRISVTARGALSYENSPARARR